jgi:acetolactate synthase-1/2/3 large subunit
MKNAELLVSILERAGARWVFGVPSGPVLPLIEAVRRSSMEFILTASETSAGFMASAVGSLTGVPGVCASTLGPGATNLTTGVGAAWLDRAPAIAITCNAATSWLGRRVQMLIDHHALFKPLTKESLPVANGQIGATMARALAVACAEPPGPVHLDLPEDVALAATTEGKSVPVEAGRPLPDKSKEIGEEVRKILERCQRPLVLIGLSGTRVTATADLLRFIEKQGMPFVTTMHGKGVLPESHPHWAGVIGRARRTDVQALLKRADVILAIGYDPVEINYEEWIGDAPIVHISTESAEVGPGVKFWLNEACDLNQALVTLGNMPALSHAWTKNDFTAHRTKLDQALRPKDARFALFHVLDILREKLPPDGVLAYDIGAHTHQIATQWRTDLFNTCISTNGWSSMGYGMPAAYAAKMIWPERKIVGVVGDGCFQMTAGELALARRLNLAVPIVVLNDGWLGLMKVKQEKKGYPLCGVYLGPPPESPPHYFGVPCRPAKDAKTFREAIDWGFGLQGPSVIEVFIDVEPYSLTVFD